MGESMSGFLNGQRKQQALSFIDEHVASDPKLAIKILDQFKIGSKEVLRDLTASQTNFMSRTGSENF